jgi:hypothetical protein
MSPICFFIYLHFSLSFLSPFVIFVDIFKEPLDFILKFIFKLMHENIKFIHVCAVLCDVSVCVNIGYCLTQLNLSVSSNIAHFFIVKTFKISLTVLTLLCSTSQEFNCYATIT